MRIRAIEDGVVEELSFIHGQTGHDMTGDMVDGFIDVFETFNEGRDAVVESGRIGYIRESNSFIATKETIEYWLNASTGLKELNEELLNVSEVLESLYDADRVEEILEEYWLADTGMTDLGEVIDRRREVLEHIQNNFIKEKQVEDISLPVYDKGGKEASLNNLYALFDRANKALQVIKEDNTMMRNWLEDNGIEVEGISREGISITTAKEGKKYDSKVEERGSYVVIDSRTKEPEKSGSGRVILFDNEVQASRYADCLNISEGFRIEGKEKVKSEQKVTPQKPIKL